MKGKLHAIVRFSQPIMAVNLILFHLATYGADQVGLSDTEIRQPTTEDQLPIEEIEVIGERNLISLQLEVNAAEVYMYDLFNDLNSTDQFDVVCRYVTPTSTIVRNWECESRFIREAFAKDTWEVMFLWPDKIPKTADEIWFENREKTQALNEEMLELAKKNPALARAMLDLNAKRQRLEEMQSKKREKTKGFFRKLFGRDDE